MTGWLLRFLGIWHERFMQSLEVWIVRRSARLILLASGAKQIPMQTMQRFAQSSKVALIKRKRNRENLRGKAMLPESTIAELTALLREADERRERIPDKCPCPTLSDPVVEALTIDDRTVYLVECPRCGFKVGSFEGFVEAIKAWNNRIQQHYEVNNGGKQESRRINNRQTN